MRPSLLLALALPLAALPPRSVAQGAPQAPPRLGSPQELCPAAPPPPACPPSAEPDVALLRALLALSEPAPDEVRVRAVEHVALLGDARGLHPLAQLLFDPSPAVQRAAVAALSRFRTPRAAGLLGEALHHPRTSEAVKLQAVDALVLQRAPSARATLEDVSRSPRHSARVQEAARRAVAAWDAPASPEAASRQAREPGAGF